MTISQLTQPVFLPSPESHRGIAEQRQALEADFSGLVEIHSARLLHIVTYLTRDRQAAEDIVQETFLRLWERRLVIVPDNVGGWLYRVAWNLAQAHLKRESGRRKVYAAWTLGQPKAVEAAEPLLQKESAYQFNKAYQQLPEQQQKIYRLSKLRGLNRREIADRMNLSPLTVRNHLTRAVQFMKEHAGAMLLFAFFFIFNHIFFHRAGTKTFPDDLYIKRQPACAQPEVSLPLNITALKLAAR
ncbi:sigma-70 family RNA polymerase sigma factor [Chitinophaga sp. NPDC101104]|uniref:sigma-70 family RNA polymerase sigma factor n=1 Tax=Chitinophaga sp. NPDC101104 TaxID=3390561 RepID=UPI003D06FD71